MSLFTGSILLFSQMTAQAWTNIVHYNTFIGLSISLGTHSADQTATAAPGALIPSFTTSVIGFDSHKFPL